MERVVRGAPLKVSENASAWRYVDTYLIKYASQTAQVDAATSETISFNVIRQRARRVGALLGDLGLQRGDVVGLKAPNNLHLTPLLLGVWRAGLTCALINPGSTERELKNICNIARPSMLISWEPLLRVTMYGHECHEVTELLNIVLNDEVIEESTLVDHESVSCFGNDPALILSSSGSTGLPKGVALSHKNIVAALFNSREYTEDNSTVGLCVLPLFHAFGLVLMLMCLCDGATFVMLPRFSLSPFLVATDRYKVTTLYLVPSLLRLLANALENDTEAVRATLRRVRRIWTGAASVRPELQNYLHTMLEGQPILGHSYGLTESTFTVLSGEVVPTKPGSPGKLTPGMECKVVAPENTLGLGPHQEGELLLRGPSLMLGYVNNEKATRDAMDDEGWLHTGDLGYYDEDGYFFLIDRAKEMIKYHAHQVSPSELEGVLCTIPGIAEAAVIGMVDPVCGELPTALVVLEPGTELTADQIQQYVACLCVQEAARRNQICRDSTKISEWQNSATEGQNIMFTPRPVNISVEPSNEDNATEPRQHDEQNTWLSQRVACLGEPRASTSTTTLETDRLLHDLNPRRSESDSFSSSDSDYGIFYCYYKYSIICILFLLMFTYGGIALLKPYVVLT